MNTVSRSDLYRRLPSVDEVLKALDLDALALEYGRHAVTDAVRRELDGLRGRITSGALGEESLDQALGALAGAVEARARQSVQGTLKKVVNASGVVIHTNLGRSPLSAEAARKMAEIATGYSNLEFDLEKGERGRRDDHARHLFDQLFARQGLTDTATIAVNNNAAAVLLALGALAKGGEVICSRGELVEIGGSFRVPEIMSQSGAVLREVGTTNRTRIADYERAITENTRLLLRVHRSNFEIIGFTEQPELAELVELGRRHGIPVMEDLGSGALVNVQEFGVPGEPNLFDSLHAGVSLVTCSGDKLLGGPQAGLIFGEPALVGALRAHPLFRALRVDKLCYAALEATLGSYLREQYDAIPLLSMMRAPAERIRQRCEALQAGLSNFSHEVVPTRAMIGGGAAPGKSLPSFALALWREGASAKDLALKLRRLPVPVVGRIEDDRVLLDLRTVAEADDAYLAGTLSGLID